jgi:hypothetical protein
VIDQLAMKRLAVSLFICFLALFNVVRSLSPPEKEALEQILATFPGLLNVNPIEIYQYSAPDDVDWGGSWTTDMSETCTGGTGWQRQGLFCDSEGHISKIRFSAGWGAPVQTNPLELTGLQWVESFQLAAFALTGPPVATQAQGASFMASVLGIPSLRRLEVMGLSQSGVFPQSAFNAANLTHFFMESTASFDHVSGFANKEYLEEVELTNGVEFSTFLPSRNTLRSLTMNGGIGEPGDLFSLEALEELTFETPQPAGVSFETNVPIPNNLRHLVINRWESPLLSLGNPSASLETLEIVQSTIEEVQFLPPSLKTLIVRQSASIDSWNLPAPCRLESFSMANSIDARIPDLAGCNNLRHFSLSQLTATALEPLLLLSYSFGPNLETFEISIVEDWPTGEGGSDRLMDLICTLPVTLKRLILSGVNLTSLPACVSRFENLDHLQLQEMPLTSSEGTNHLANFSSSIAHLLVNPNALGLISSSSPDQEVWTNLVTQFPGLKTFRLTSTALNQPFPADQLKLLTQMEKLELHGTGFVGSIPADFLAAMPNLKFLGLSSNLLSGTIPATGWANVEEVRLYGNQFTAFPYLLPPGAPKLRILDLSYLPLTGIPDDGSFRLIPNLRELYLRGLSHLDNVRFPAFWADGSQKLNLLVSDGSNFQGTLPSPIQSPYLRLLQVRNNSLCGPLPEMTGPMGLVSLAMNLNHFSGTIPASWGTHLTIAMGWFMNNNLLEGTLPNPLATNMSTILTGYFHDNYFTGPLPSMKQIGNPYMQFNVRGENMTMDWCGRNPEWTTFAQPQVNPDPSVCHCMSYYDPPLDLTPLCSAPLSPPSSPTPIIPPDHICITPPETPPAPISSPAETPNPPSNPANFCPPPAPGPSFVCVNGIWQSNGSVTQPSLTIPRPIIPGSTTVVLIGGNLTVESGGVTFDGFETQIVVNGCIFLGDNGVVVELTKEEIEQLSKEGSLSKTLVTSLSGNGCIGSTDLSMTGVFVKKGSGSKGCRKVKAKNSGSTKSSLHVIFSIDNSSCNMMIIIPCVIGGVLIIVAVAVVVGLHLRKQMFAKPSKQ